MIAACVQNLVNSIDGIVMCVCVCVCVCVCFNRFIAKVLDIDKEGKKVKVHFAGWGNRFDEWVEIEGQRLREAGPNAVERFHRKRDKPVIHNSYYY